MSVFIQDHKQNFLKSTFNNNNNSKQSQDIRQKIIFTGRVQGVGFRYESFNAAKQLGLVGWVKNMKNGEVELEVEGAPNKIKYMIEYLTTIKRAPVSKISISKIAVLASESSFYIK